MIELLQQIAALLQYIELLNRQLTPREVAQVADLQRRVEHAIARERQNNESESI